MSDMNMNETIAMTRLLEQEDNKNIIYDLEALEWAHIYDIKQQKIILKIIDNSNSHYEYNYLWKEVR